MTDCLDSRLFRSIFGGAAENRLTGSSQLPCHFFLRPCMETFIHLQSALLLKDGFQIGIPDDEVRNVGVNEGTGRRCGQDELSFQWLTIGRST